jgi:glycosyltransferase involved in cell wall biosynthesis
MKPVQVFENTAFQNRPPGQRPAVAVSIAFYNNTAVLDLTLAALERQSFQDFEILICDDGSKPEAVQHVQNELNRLKNPARHLWHADLGFRKNRILNWGIHYCTSDYMIFLDQDCLAHPEFVREHVENRKAHSLLCGRRMDLTPWVSKRLTPAKVRGGFIEKNLWWILPTGLYMKDNNGGKGLHLKNQFLRRWANQKERGIVGCNFSVHREDLLKINGFDFRYEGAGTGEDTDIEYRLKLLDVKMIPFVNTAVQYHVYHRLLKRISKNEEIFSQVQSEKKAVTDFGLKQQLQELN